MGSPKGFARDRIECTNFLHITRIGLKFQFVQLVQLKVTNSNSWVGLDLTKLRRLRVQQVHEKWVNIRTLLQTKLINILNIHTNPDFKFLAECTEWVHQKLVSASRPPPLIGFVTLQRRPRPRAVGGGARAAAAPAAAAPRLPLRRGRRARDHRHQVHQDGHRDQEGRVLWRKRRLQDARGVPHVCPRPVGTRQKRRIWFGC